MEEYLYIIVGVAALIFNIYRKAQKNKLKQQAEETKTPQPERKPFVPKNFPQDLLDELDNAFGNAAPKVEHEPEMETQIDDTIEIVDFDTHTPKKNVAENKKVEKVNTQKSKIKFNIKDAIIYNTILERKY